MKPIRLPIINIDRINKTCIVESKAGHRFPVKITLPENEIRDVLYGDDAIVVKSSVSHEWLMIDYHVGTVTNYSIHNSYQNSLDNVICDEKGVPYE